MPEIELENAPRPAGQREDYRFFRDNVSGQVFKALHETRTADGGDPALTISVAPVGDDGKALLNPLEQPDVYWHTHTFTAVELADPEFNLDARVATIILEAVTRKQAQIGARGALEQLSSAWSGAADLPLDPVPVVHVVSG